jgi:hypothetical protein
MKRSVVFSKRNPFLIESNVTGLDSCQYIQKYIHDEWFRVRPTLKYNYKYDVEHCFDESENENENDNEEDDTQSTQSTHSTHSTDQISDNDIESGESVDNIVESNIIIENQIEWFIIKSSNSNIYHLVHDCAAMKAMTTRNGNIPPKIKTFKTKHCGNQQYDSLCHWCFEKVCK